MPKCPYCKTGNLTLYNSPNHTARPGVWLYSCDRCPRRLVVEADTEQQALHKLATRRKLFDKSPKTPQKDSNVPDDTTKGDKQ